MKTENLYLVAHMCRGQPQLDVAEKDYRGEFIVCSSGHAAYPYWTQEIGTIIELVGPIPEMPEGLEDHYVQVMSRSKKSDAPSVDVLHLLGMAKPREVKDFKRRF